MDWSRGFGVIEQKQNSYGRRRSRRLCAGIICTKILWNGGIFTWHHLMLFPEEGLKTRNEVNRKCWICFVANKIASKVYAGHKHLHGWPGT